MFWTKLVAEGVLLSLFLIQLQGSTGQEAKIREFLTEAWSHFPEWLVANGQEPTKPSPIPVDLSVYNSGIINVTGEVRNLTVIGYSDWDWNLVSFHTDLLEDAFFSVYFFTSNFTILGDYNLEGTYRDSVNVSGFGQFRYSDLPESTALGVYFHNVSVRPDRKFDLSSSNITQALRFMSRFTNGPTLEGLEAGGNEEAVSSFVKRPFVGQAENWFPLCNLTVQFFMEVFQNTSIPEMIGNVSLSDPSKMIKIGRRPHFETFDPKEDAFNDCIENEFLTNFNGWIAHNGFDPLALEANSINMTIQKGLTNLTGEMINRELHGMGTLKNVYVNAYLAQWPNQTYHGFIRLAINLDRLAAIGDYEVDGELLNYVPVTGSGSFNINQSDNVEFGVDFFEFVTNEEGFVKLNWEETHSIPAFSLTDTVLKLKGLEAGGFEDDVEMMLRYQYYDSLDEWFPGKEIVYRFLQELFDSTPISEIIGDSV